MDPIDRVGRYQEILSIKQSLVSGYNFMESGCLFHNLPVDKKVRVVEWI